MLPKLYQKKPVSVYAVQFDGTSASAHEICAWILRQGGRADIVFGEGAIYHDAISIDTLEGRMTAIQNDWIIRGIKGEFYPCKQDIFAETYEEVGNDVADR